ILHRDVKPSNILVSRGRKATLVDFGLLKRMQDDAITDHGRVVGTYRYMSPEQAHGEALDRRSDIYSLGASLWELLAGRPGFAHANQFELLQAIIYQPPPDLTRINPGAPGALCRLAERMIVKRRGDRPGNAGEVALLLRAIGGGVAGVSEPLLVRPPREVLRPVRPLPVPLRLRLRHDPRPSRPRLLAVRVHVVDANPHPRRDSSGSARRPQHRQPPGRSHHDGGPVELQLGVLNLPVRAVVALAYLEPERARQPVERGPRIA